MGLCVDLWKIGPENRTAYGTGKADAIPTCARLGRPQLHAVMVKAKAVRQHRGG